MRFHDHHRRLHRIGNTPELRRVNTLQAIDHFGHHIQRNTDCAAVIEIRLQRLQTTEQAKHVTHFCIAIFKLGTFTTGFPEMAHRAQDF